MADTALIFPSLCFWQYSLDILSAIFLVVLPISFVHYIHGYMKALLAKPNPDANYLYLMRGELTKIGEYMTSC